MKNKKLLYALLVLLVVLLAWQFLFLGVAGRFESLDREIEAKTRTLQEIRLIEREYFHDLEELRDLGSVLLNRQRDYTPLSFLERLAVETGVKYELVYREPRAIRNNADFMESAVMVELREINMHALIEYLYGIESSGEFLRIRNLNIRPQDNLLRVNFEVVAIVPAG